MFKKLFEEKEEKREYKVREFLRLDEIPYEVFPFGKTYIFSNEDAARQKAKELYDKSVCLLGQFMPVYKGDEYLGAGTVSYIHIAIYEGDTIIDSLHYYEGKEL